jgi:hypothetical protein
VPRFEIDGDMQHQYNGIAELSNISSAIVVLNPTGESFSRPIPAVAGATQSPAPVDYVRMTVVKVLSGAVEIGKGNKIDVVSPGIDLNTGQLGLLKGAPCLLFLTPAMLDADRPLGGYVVAGGPNGVFCQADSKKPNDFTSAFASQNSTLPTVLTIGKSNIPQITHSEQELLDIGPQ